jgi:hypothetical protein
MYGPASSNSYIAVSSKFTIYWFVTATHPIGRPRLSHLCELYGSFLTFGGQGGFVESCPRRVFDACSASY